MCSILFEQCNGNLDASIEAILKMQSADVAEETKKESEQPEGTSLVANDAEPSDDKKEEGKASG